MKEKFVKIMKENGFLIFLFICVCAVAIGTIRIATDGVDKGRSKGDVSSEVNENIKVDLSTEVEELDLDDIYVVEDEDEFVPEELEVPEEFNLVEEVFYEEFDTGMDDDMESIENQIAETTKISKEIMMPVQGDILTDFSKDKLIYSETLDEWRGHGGIDIKAQIGSKVVAPMAGIVSKAYEDSLWGKTIVIDHGDGLETKYSNLGTLEMVKVGLGIKEGDYISTVGKTAQIELLMEDHLHFEVIRNKKTVDPRSIIK